MKINRIDSQTDWRELDTAHAGTAVRFKHPFHQQNCQTDAVFMVMQIASCYRPESNQYRHKVAVANLNNGKLSYIDGERHVEVLRSEVNIGCRS